jgi:hypothetical protein
MGYETKLMIGQIYDNAKENYFLQIAEVDLCKCGYEGPMSNLIDKVMSKDNVLGLKETYYTHQFQVRKEEVKKHLIGGERNIEGLTEEMLDKVIEEAESWEHDIRTDSYGDVLRAVPVEMVIEAIKKTMQIAKAAGEKPYRRYLMALPLLKTIKRTFGHTKRNQRIFCILYGY